MEAIRPSRYSGTFKGFNFAKDIGERRQIQLRVNTLEDLFPGGILQAPIIAELTRLLRRAYDLPLHYELIFSAQTELKRRNYHIAVMEAETAFEVYASRTLVETAVATGASRQQMLADMENPRVLGLLGQRLNRLDAVIDAYRQAQHLAHVPPFVDSAEHKGMESVLV